MAMLDAMLASHDASCMERCMADRCRALLAVITEPRRLAITRHALFHSMRLGFRANDTRLYYSRLLPAIDLPPPYLLRAMYMPATIGHAAIHGRPLSH